MNNTVKPLDLLDSMPIFGEIGFKSGLSCLMQGKGNAKVAPSFEYRGDPSHVVVPNLNLNASSDHSLWVGSIPHAKKPGTYIQANLSRTSEVAPLGSGYLRSRCGHNEAMVSSLINCFMESDEDTLNNQLLWLNKFESDTNLRASLVVLSGDVRSKSVDAAGCKARNEIATRGKSLHYFFPITPADLSTWVSIQKHLIVFSHGDPAILNPDRLMRVGGIVGGRDLLASRNTPRDVRIQTILRSEMNGANDPLKLLEALESHAARLGIKDIEKAFSARKTVAYFTKKLSSGNLKADVAAQMQEVVEYGRMYYGFTESQLEFIASATSDSRVLSTTPGDPSRKGGKKHPTKILPRDFLVYTPEGHYFKYEDFALVFEKTGMKKIPCFDPIEENPNHSKSASAVLYPTGCIHSMAHGNLVNYYPAPESVSLIDVDSLLDLSPSASSKETLNEEIEARYKKNIQLIQEEMKKESAVDSRRREYVREVLDNEFDINSRSSKKEEPKYCVEEVESAQRSHAYAKTLLKECREHMRSEGLPEQKGRAVCGMTHLLFGTENYTLVSSEKRCGSINCPFCGPMRLATKISGACYMPLMSRDGSHPIAPAFACSGVIYKYEMSFGELNKFTERLYKNGVDAPNTHSFILGASTPFFTEAPVAKYLSFTREGRTIVLSTIELKASQKTGKGAPIATIQGEDAIKEEIKNLAFWSTHASSMTLDEEEDKTITFNMSSSRGLSLDPVSILKKARNCRYIQIVSGTKSVRESVDAFNHYQVKVANSHLEEESERSNFAQTEHVAEPSVIMAIAGAVASSTPAGFYPTPIRTKDTPPATWSPPVVPEQVNQDTILEGLDNLLYMTNYIPKKNVVVATTKTLVETVISSMPGIPSFLPDFNRDDFLDCVMYS